jgi:hypothetical protein
MGDWARFMQRFALGLCTILALGPLLGGCGGWPQARTYAVKHTADAGSTFQAVQEVVAQENYRVIERDDAGRTLKLRTHVDESSDKVSTITLKVDDAGTVSLLPGGFLARENGTIHHRLDDELSALELAIATRLAKDLGPPSGSSGPLPASAAGTPQAWVEPSSDTARWGTGNFTCLPVHIPAEDTAQIALRLSTGEIAQVTLSLAYADSLCRSPAACGNAAGCPALGIGDAEQVQALATLVGSQKVAATATLLYKGQAAVLVDLSRHGSIAQALGQTPPPPAE